MKNLLKKLHIVSSKSEDGEGSGLLQRGGLSQLSPSREHKHFSGLSNWLNSISSRRNPNPPSSSNAKIREQSDPPNLISSGHADMGLEAVRGDSESVDSKDPEIDEEYQIQIAMELSAREDPEAVQIEAVKQISLGSSAVDNTPAEVVAYRYWNYNALSCDDRVLDGFYDLYGVSTDSSSGRMPSLIDLQDTSSTGSVQWEAILVNRAGDSNLLRLEEKALEMAFKLRSGLVDSRSGYLVRKLAVLVSDFMGGPVGDPENMLRAWQKFSCSLKETLGNKVLPLGSLTIGLSRHRALLFKVLADSLGIPCKLVKGQQFSGSSDAAMNFVKLDDGREYIVDLMSDPGTLIPSDAAGLNREYDESVFSASPLSSSRAASSSSGVASSYEERSEFGTFDKKSRLIDVAAIGNDFNNNRDNPQRNLIGSAESAKTSLEDSKNLPPTGKLHTRSPSWTEGVSSPAVRRMKVKDVSHFMLDAAKENPRLAQKLHDVLLESGVVAPPNLFTDICSGPVDSGDPPEDESRRGTGSRESTGEDFLPPLPHQKLHDKVPSASGPNQQEQSEVNPTYAKNVPAAAAAAAAAAVVASSMVVAAAKLSSDPNLELPVTAAATVTAAAVVATTAAVSKQYEQGLRSDGEAEASSSKHRGSGGNYQETDSPPRGNSGGERVSDRSLGNDSSRSDLMFDEVLELEIQWEEITLGERIGLGSYGEVYRGEWHGTEVAVKRFLDQDISGESLEEFKSEIRIMTKLRHPNVVLFMGAVTRPPNLSIVTEFLPRGSLYRLIHRPNNLLDERRRLKMALDAARGLNYLHSCNPVIVHRDLKSPNLLVDKNWVVKVCDFGLSRRKHSTFLSSRSTAGTAEWMAPEVLRNEPSNEKCDVYSFGVILWELFTMQQPWGGMNPMQVVGAVGYQHRRLDIPDDMDPVIADIIRKCWETDPKLRPSFAEIMAALKPLQKPITSSHVPRPTS
ncbi:probable serine/threonine-protein kinase SIS8 isoform X2 [Punica granatum]|uniref:non-specific serine/threonine protein kinase n=2 Tax=Punica granatum TaxID=22663 RepID=A0A6P8BSJ0_PUNGR|nr:probable serine/threonine-protein kinase SIS8 isoform X2 [Punica granatum]